MVLVGLGGLVIVKGFLAGEGGPIGHVDWRAVILITASLLFFGITVRGLGVVGALFGHDADCDAGARGDGLPRGARHRRRR